jgi:hypothetical protein
VTDLSVPLALEGGPYRLHVYIIIDNDRRASVIRDLTVEENVIAVGGQSRGANTAIIIKATNSTTFFDLDVQEILAKPIQKRLPSSQ